MAGGMFVKKNAGILPENKGLQPLPESCGSNLSWGLTFHSKPIMMNKLVAKTG